MWGEPSMNGSPEAIRNTCKQSFGNMKETNINLTNTFVNKRINKKIVKAIVIIQ